MEFNEKLQELRKRKGLTQEELAEKLYISRTAISKWESGRGMPSIESLKAISKFFAVTLDDLLSGEELLVLAEDEHRQKAIQSRDIVFALLDCSMALLFFLPFFAQETSGIIQAVSLLTLQNRSLYLRIAYIAVVLGIAVFGLISLVLQNCRHSLWTQNKSRFSCGLHIVVFLLFVLSRQPYASVYSFVFLLLKLKMLMKQQ